MSVRNWRVDTLRGYFLVAMTLGHFPNPLARVTEYTFGYASSPDAFVFLSGLVSTWVYLPLRQKRGPTAMVARVFRRVGTIYFTHMLLVVASLIVALHYDLFGLRVAHPMRTFISGLLLQNQRGFDRILPMYCIFLAFTPLVLKQFREGRAWLIGLISAGLWMGAQFGLGAIPDAAHIGREGFNLFAWQAYFVAGQYLGFRGLLSKQSGPNESTANESSTWKSHVLLAACFLIAMLLLVDRHLALGGMHPLLGFTPHPGHNPIRFLDAACLGYLIWRIPHSVDLVAMKLWFFRFLNLLGRHSLQVFAFSMLITRFEAHATARLSWEAKLIIAVVTVASLGLPAWIHSRLRPRLQAYQPTWLPWISREPVSLAIPVHRA